MQEGNSLELFYNEQLVDLEEQFRDIERKLIREKYSKTSKVHKKMERELNDVYRLRKVELVKKEF